MTPDQIEAAAQSLFDAEQGRTPIPPVSARYPAMTLSDAYAVQAGLVRRKRATGLGVVGWKIGLTSRAMQQAMGLDAPDSGILFTDMLFADGATVPAGRFIRPLIEAEIAFVMKAPLAGHGVSRADVVKAVDFVAPSLEILDFRTLATDPVTGAGRRILDTVADNAANAGIVLGAQRHRLDAFDLRWAGAIVKRDGVVEETGLGAGVLDDPVLGILWLVQRLADYGQGIAAGDVLLSGSFIRPVEAPAGCRFEADFGPFGHVSVNFA